MSWAFAESTMHEDSSPLRLVKSGFVFCGTLGCSDFAVTSFAFLTSKSTDENINKNHYREAGETKLIANLFCCRKHANQFIIDHWGNEDAG